VPRYLGNSRGAIGLIWGGRDQKIKWQLISRKPGRNGKGIESDKIAII